MTRLRLLEISRDWRNDPLTGLFFGKLICKGFADRKRRRTLNRTINRLIKQKQAKIEKEDRKNHKYKRLGEG